MLQTGKYCKPNYENDKSEYLENSFVLLCLKGIELESFALFLSRRVFIIGGCECKTRENLYEELLSTYEDFSKSSLDPSDSPLTSFVSDFARAVRLKYTNVMPLLSM